MIGPPHAHAAGPLAVVTVLTGLIAGCVNPSTRIESYESPAAAAPPPAPPPASGRGHRVVRGDTLYGIAFRYGLDYRDVAAWNGIGEPYTIYPDQWIRLDPPGATALSAPALPPAAEPHAPQPPPSIPAEAPDPVAADVQTAAARTEALHLPPGAEPLPPPRPGLMVSEPEPVPAPTMTGSAAVVATPAPPAASAAVPLAPAGAAPLAGAASSAEPAPAPAVVTAPVPPAAAGSAGLEASPPPPGSDTPVATLAAPTAPAPAAAGRDPGAPRAVREGWSWPMAGRLITRFVPGDSTRGGIDIAGRAGQTVYAAADGEVVYSGTGIIGYGELIVIKHGPELLSAYGHNQRRLVQEGQRVQRGQPIAEVGRDAHRRELLHFEVRRRGRPIDPLSVLPAQP